MKHVLNFLRQPMDVVLHVCWRFSLFGMCDVTLPLSDAVCCGETSEQIRDEDLSERDLTIVDQIDCCPSGFQCWKEGDRSEVGKSKCGLGLKSDLWRKLLDLDLTWTRPLEDLDLLGLRHFFRSPDHYSSVSDVSWFFPFLFALSVLADRSMAWLWTIKTNMTKISTEDWNIRRRS